MGVLYEQRFAESVGRSKLPLACDRCGGFDLMPQLNEGWASCNRCFTVRPLVASREEFTAEWQRLIAMFAVWRDAIEADPSSPLAIEAEIALRWRLGVHSITVPLDALRREAIETQIAALEPTLMLEAPERYTSDQERAASRFGSRVTGSGPVVPPEIMADGTRVAPKWEVEHDYIPVRL